MSSNGRIPEIFRSEGRTWGRNIHASQGVQASLAHLAWQANPVAEGELNQKVQFLGELSDAFNRMIHFLYEKKSLIQRFKLITDVLGEGALMVDADGKLIFSNPEAARLTGYRFDEIEGGFIHVRYRAKENGRNQVQYSVE